MHPAGQLTAVGASRLSGPGPPDRFPIAARRLQDSPATELAHANRSSASPSIRARDTQTVGLDQEEGVKTSDEVGGTRLANVLAVSHFLKNAVLHPKHPERVCWGCDRYCPSNDLACGNGCIRSPHPCELFGDDWNEASPDSGEKSAGHKSCGENEPREPR